MPAEGEDRLSGCAGKPVLRSRTGFTVGWKRPFRHTEEPFPRAGRGFFALRQSLSCDYDCAKRLTLNGLAEVPENGVFASGWRLAGKYAGIAELVVYKYSCTGERCINIRSAGVAIRASVRGRAMRLFMCAVNRFYALPLCFIYFGVF